MITAEPAQGMFCTLETSRRNYRTYFRVTFHIRASFISGACILLPPSILPSQAGLWIICINIWPKYPWSWVAVQSQCAYSDFHGMLCIPFRMHMENRDHPGGGWMTQACPQFNRREKKPLGTAAWELCQCHRSQIKYIQSTNPHWHNINHPLRNFSKISQFVQIATP